MTTAPRKLTGAQRAALVLLGLDEAVATEIVRRLSDDEMQKLADGARSLDPVPVEALEPAFEAFARTMEEPVMRTGSGAYLRRLTAAAVGDERAQRLFDPPGEVGAAPDPMLAIRNARTSTLVDLLQVEHPQVVAAVLSQLPESRAAEVLAALPEDTQTDLLRRIAGLQEIPAQAVQTASSALAKSLASSGGLADGARAAFDGVAYAAALLNELPASDSERLLTGLSVADANLPPKIREAMFTFEDLGRLTTRDLQVLLRAVDAQSLLVALKTTSDTLRNHFLSAVSSRAAQTMREDLALMPPMRLSEVEKAQRTIVEAAMRLSTEGSLTLPGAKAERLV